MSKQRKSPFNGANGTTNNPFTTDDSKRRRLNIKTPAKFPETVSTGYTTMKDIEVEINKVFSAAFTDWHGCRMSMNQGGFLDLEFFFKPTPPVAGEDLQTSRRAFVPIEVNLREGANDIENRIAQIDASTKRNVNFKLTPYAAELLYSFLSTNCANQVSWEKPDAYTKRNLVSEINEPQPFGVGYGRPVTYCRVGGLDIFKVVREVYGKKDENGSYWEYAIIPLRPHTSFTYNFNGQNQNLTSNWLIAMSRMTKEQAERTFATLGVSGGTGISVNTAKE